VCTGALCCSKSVLANCALTCTVAALTTTNSIQTQGARGGGGGSGGGAGVILSKSSGLRKWRSEARSRQRASKQSSKDHFLHEEVDDA
jgi:hypothetical protein